MAHWNKLPRWVRWLLGVLAFLVLVYLFGFLVFACGTEAPAPIAPTEQG